ncbi:MAG: helix-turn-helix domain-containing protein [Flavobacteriales bacterium]|nr:helix-turn-helix domain-containing protein [Flavobacteriales bacterium]
MNIQLSVVQIQVGPKIYLKDPETSELGKRIISGSIEMINEIGFESFTFRKLGVAILSTEASIYRYFESKNKLLLYLTSWYWAWMEYNLVFAVANLKSPKEKLDRAMNLLTAHNFPEVHQDFPHMRVDILQEILVYESSKAYLIKEVDSENKIGAYLAYKRFVGRLSMIILEINPRYKYPHMLISTVIEGIHHQRFFAAHLPALTDFVKGEDAVSKCYTDLIFKTIATKK